MPVKVSLSSYYHSGMQMMTPSMNITTFTLSRLVPQRLRLPHGLYEIKGSKSPKEGYPWAMGDFNIDNTVGQIIQVLHEMPSSIRTIQAHSGNTSGMHYSRSSTVHDMGANGSTIPTRNTKSNNTFSIPRVWVVCGSMIRQTKATKGKKPTVSISNTSLGAPAKHIPGPKMSSISSV